MKLLTPSTFIKSICAALLATLIASGATLTAAMTAGKIEVAEIKGDVKIAYGEGGKASPLKTGVVIGPGATVFTGVGGVANLWFSNGAHVIVQSSTELAINKFSIVENANVPKSGFHKISAEPSYSHTQLSVRQGKILVEVSKLKVPLSEFKVRTPFFVSEVKGTVFFVEHAENFGRLGVIRGVVSVTPLQNLAVPVDVVGDRVSVYRLRENKEFVMEETKVDPREARQVLNDLTGGSAPVSDSGREPGDIGEGGLPLPPVWDPIDSTVVTDVSPSAGS
ncbi:MAG: FecR domain-containing protein [Puniceicoccales bacterium]|nr:FecR domain-containing protein [Puniceicoccales bacterium]